jgi:hypothetical protein
MRKTMIKVDNNMELKEDTIKETTLKNQEREFGVLKEHFISMSNDFDETPDCFKEYM